MEWLSFKIVNVIMLHGSALPLFESTTITVRTFRRGELILLLLPVSSLRENELTCPKLSRRSAMISNIR